VLLRSVALVITDVSEELSACINRMTRIGGLLTVNVLPSSPILVTLMMEALSSSETSVLQEPHGVTSQKTSFFGMQPNFQYCSGATLRICTVLRNPHSV
jgi:acetylglutamate synthase